MEIPKPPVGSPWYDMSVAAPPNIKWCEEQLTGWFIEPANTWSNLLFIIVGIYIMFHCRRYKDPFLRVFGPGSIIVGAGSFVWHMSYNFYTQLVDFYAMYIIFLIPLIYNFRRLKWIDESNVYSYFFLLINILTGMVVVFHILNIPFQSIVFILIVLTIVSEVIISRMEEEHRKSYKSFGLAILCLGIGAIFSALDAARIYCDPHDHIFQGHAIWHIMCALTVLFAYKFYTQFDKARFFDIK